MAKAKKKKPVKSKSNSAKPPSNRQPVPKVSKTEKRKGLVWQIFHFKERYELPDDMRGFRVSGLQYTKRFVGVAGGDEAVGYHRQFGILQNGDGLEDCMLEGIYGRLVNMAAQHSRAKRGYLLDAADDPLTDSQIGKLLKINCRTMSKYLRRFAEVKLIEKVEMPDEFDLSLNEPPPRKKTDYKGDKGDSGKGKGGPRNSPGNSGENRAPLKNGKRQTAKPPNGGKGKGKQKATNGLTAINAKGKENGKAHRHQANAQGEGCSRGQVKDEPPSAPATTPPLPSEPHVSDALGESQVIPFPAPQTSLSSAGGPQRGPLGSSAVDYDKYDEQVGTKIYLALGFTANVTSAAARREICSFASKWHQSRASLARLPPEVVDQLGRRVIDEARKIGRRKGNRNRAAVVNTVIDKLVTARLREAM